MSKIDYLDLDGRLMNLFLAVFEEGSVTRAARRLGLTQSAVSHSLDKLRVIIGDPLFVRSGRGITATARAGSMAEEVRTLLIGMRSITEGETFDPAHAKGRFVIAASDFQRDLLLPGLLTEMQHKAPNLQLKVMNSDAADPKLLREGQCDLVISPFLPDGAEFMQQKLYDDHFVCFFDPDVVKAPIDIADYLSRSHVKVVFSSNEHTQVDEKLAADGLSRKVALLVPSFSALPHFMRGQDYIVVLPSLMKHTVLKGFETGPCPVELAKVSFHMTWHAKNTQSGLHKWIRGLLQKQVLQIQI